MTRERFNSFKIDELLAYITMLERDAARWRKFEMLNQQEIYANSDPQTYLDGPSVADLIDSVPGEQ